MDSTRQKSGDLIVFEPAISSNDWKPCHYAKYEESVSDMISQRTQEHAGQFILDPDKSWLFSSGAIVLSEQEWLEMDTKRGT